MTVLIPSDNWKCNMCDQVTVIYIFLINFYHASCPIDERMQRKVIIKQISVQAVPISPLIILCTRRVESQGRARKRVVVSVRIVDCRIKHVYCFAMYSSERKKKTGINSEWKASTDIEQLLLLVSLLLLVHWWN